MKKTNPLILIILVCLFGYSLYATDNQTPDEYLLASKVFREGNIDSALSKYENFIKDFGSGSKISCAEFMAGECYFKQQKYPQAAAIFQNVIRKYNEDENILINATYRLAECNYNMEKYLIAVKYFNKCKEFKNKIIRAESIYGLALCNLAIEEYPEARNLLLELLQFYPGYQNDRRVILPLSLLLIENGKLKEALENLGRLPDDTAAIFYSGIALQKMNKIMEANTLFKKILEKDPGSPWAYRAQFQIGETFYQARQFPLSSDIFQKLILNFPESPLRPQALYRLACADFQNGAFGESSLKLDNILQNFPENPLHSPAQYLRAEASLRQGDFATAAGKYSELLNINELAMQANFKIVWLYAKMGHYDLAIAQANQFLKNYHWGELAAKVYLTQAISFQKIQKYDKAVASYQKIIDLFPNSIYFEKALFLKAECYYEAKLYSELITNIYEIVKNSPASPSTWRAQSYYWIAEGYYALEKYDLAREVYQIIIRNYPESDTVAEALQAISACYAKEKDFESAKLYQEKALARAMESRDKNISSSSILETANILFNQEQYEKAVTYYDEFIQKNPNGEKLPQALYQQGIALYRLQYYSEALKRWNRLSTNYRTNQLASKALFQSGKVLFGLEKYDEAIQAFLDLINSCPGSESYKEAHLQIAQCYYNKGDIENAIGQYKNFLINYPDDENYASVLEQLQTCYYRQGKTNEELEKLVGQFPKSRLAADTYWKLGAKAFNDKDYPKAHEYLQKIIMDFPESTQVNKAYYYEAETYFMEEKNAEAVTAYKNFLSNFSKDDMAEQAQFRLGVTYFKMEDYRQTIVAFSDFLDVYPGSELARDCVLNIALAYKKAQMPNEAIETYERFVDKYPAGPKASFSRIQIGLLNESQLKYKEAIGAFKKVPKDDGSSCLEALFYTGRCYHQLKASEEETNTYSEMLALGPKDNEFRVTGLLRLAEIYEETGNTPKSLEIYNEVIASGTNAEWTALAQDKIQTLSQKN